MFLNACREHFCEEPALFLLAFHKLRMEVFQNGHGTVEAHRLLAKIYRDFIKKGAIYQLPLSKRLRRLLIEDLGTRREVTRASKLRGRMRDFILPLTPVPEDEVIDDQAAQPSSLDKLDVHLYAACDEMEQLLTQRVSASDRSGVEGIVGRGVMSERMT